MGGKKFVMQLKGMGRTLTESEGSTIIDVYRETYPSIKNLWKEGDTVLNKMIDKTFEEDTSLYFGEHKCVLVDEHGITLPNGLGIRYKNLRKEDETIVSEVEDEADITKSRTVYDSRKGSVSIWGGTFVENVVQALARIIVGEQMVQINKHYQVVLTVHDAAVVVVPEDEAEKAVEIITGLMSTPPAWASGLPVACEAEFAERYGDC
jgi:DNA polymerase